MKAKAVVRDVGRVLEMPFADVDKVAKQIPPALDMTLDKALEESAGAAGSWSRTIRRSRSCSRVARRLEGHDAPRLGARRRRRDRAEGDHRVRAALQGGARRNHHPVVDEGDRAHRPPEDGLPRAEHADADLRRDRGDQARPTGVDARHRHASRSTMPKTYQVFQDGQTYGIFQFESSGMRDILRKAKPQRLDDLIALNALYRPGPLRSGMVDDFIARKQGKTEVKYELPAARADPGRHLRRHRLPGTGDAHRERARRLHARRGRPAAQGDGQEERRGHGEACAASSSTARRSTGINEKKAAHIFDLMEHFAGYGFNKSHSTAYALLAYQTAYLKANYPWHFAAALLTIEAQNTDKLALYLGECRDRGIPVLPPDINESQLRVHGRARQGRPLRPDRDQERRRGRDRVAARRPQEAGPHHARCTRSARISICGWSTSACSRAWSRPARSIRSRSEHGVRRRCRPRRCGRGCSPPSTPPASTARGMQRDRERRPGAAVRRRRTTSAGADGGGRRGGVALPAAAPWTETEQLGFEKETLGLYWSGHPVDRYAERAAGSSARASTGELAEAPVGGARGDAWGPGGPQADRARHQHRRHRRRLPPAEDAQGRSHGGLHARGRAGRRRSDRVSRGVSARGGADRDRHAGAGARQARARRRDRCAILASEIVPLDSVRERLAREVAIRLQAPADRGMFEALGEIFARHRGDRRVSFEIELPAAAEPAARQRRRHRRRSASGPRPTLIAEVEQIVGQGAVSLR